MGIGVIITMTTLTVASAVGEKVLNGMGKSDASQMLSVATICGICITGLSIFGKLITELSKLGA